MTFTLKNLESKHTPEIQAIMSNIPSVVISWGTPIIFMIFLVMIAATKFVRYPRSLVSKAKVELHASEIYVCIDILGKDIHKVAIGQSLYISGNFGPKKKHPKLLGKVTQILTNPNPQGQFIIKIKIISTAGIKLSDRMSVDAQIHMPHITLFDLLVRHNVNK